MTAPRAEIQTLNPGSLVVLFKLDCQAIGGSVYYFTPNLNAIGGYVVWQGQEYIPMPIAVSGFSATSKGSLPHPKLQVSNLDGLVGALVNSLDDLTGAIITRKQVLTKYLDAVNFAGGVNATADPSRGYDDDIWVVEQKTNETWEAITFDLVALSDAQGLKLPAEIIQTATCTWIYKGGDLCTYAGSLSTCDRGLKTTNGCVAHFGSGVPLPFSGFPGALPATA